MNTVDERILIPSSPQLVWGYISDLRNNVEWQTNCLNMSFLTTHTKGQGTRWRNKTQGGREYVIEISAWYERLGYEYRIIDGSPYKMNLGRLRLQDTPEGTVVQWTFSYEPTGIFGGIRNAVSLKRSIENDVVDSLWALWRNVSQMSKDSQAEYMAKSLMQEAPDVEARARYKPRHVSIMQDADSHRHLDINIEPPISDDDTKPRPSISTAETLAVHSKEPDFLIEVTDVALVSGEMPATSSQVDESFTDTPEPFFPPSGYDAPVLMTPVVITTSEPYEPEASYLRDEDTRTEAPTFQKPDPPNVDDIPYPGIKTTDTSEISVFDIFGIPKPSSTQQTKAVVPDPLPISTPETVSSVLVTPTRPLFKKAAEVEIKGRRLGMRFITRQNLSKTRRP